MKRAILAVGLGLGAWLPPALGADAISPSNETAASGPELITFDFWKGVDLRSPAGHYTAHIDLRTQMRFTHSDHEDGTSSDESKFQRVRFKLGGRLYHESLAYYTEYDFPSERLLDLRFTVSPDEALQFRFGQWKAPYSREQVDSSGNQQFVDRSLANAFFTLDRQQGAVLFGRLAEGQVADSWYNLGVFAGSGRGGEFETGARPLLVGRWQWNFLKRDPGFSQGDVNYRDKPAAALALGGATWRGAYTAFSSAGGGQLPGFAPGDEDRYDVGQTLVEAIWQYRGFSFQSELHWKRVRDTAVQADTELTGGYVQAGVFPHTLWPGVPRPLELAVRYARVDPDRARVDDSQREGALAANWFFNGHRNKLTLEFARTVDDAAPAGHRKLDRVRLQWDISI